MSLSIDESSKVSEPLVLGDTPKQGPFLAELESVRGLAAVSVAIFHSAHVVPVDGKLQIYLKKFSELDTVSVAAMRLLMTAFSGGAAVSMFFVLSGFVLMQSLMRDQRAPVPLARSFVGRRILRIYPALFVNLVIMAIALSLPTKSLVENLALQSPSVNGASWSLFVELFAIPLMLCTFAAVRFGGSAAMLAIVVISITFPYQPRFYDIAYTIVFWFMFAFGMAAAYWRPSRLPAGPLAIAAAATALVCARPVFGYLNAWALLTEAISSTYIVTALAFSKHSIVHEALRAPMVRFLGAISYSFYLYHPLSLALLTPYLLPLGDTIGPVAVSLIMSVLTIAITLPMAWISFRIIEAPSVRLSRKYF